MTPGQRILLAALILTIWVIVKLTLDGNGNGPRH
jgi:hypothetical protein